MVEIHQKIPKEIRVGVDMNHVWAFSEAVANSPGIDFAKLNNHLAVRHRISGQLVEDGSARINASIDGGRLVVYINGGKIDVPDDLTEGVFNSVLDVFCGAGRGREIAGRMLKDGEALMLNGFHS